MTWGIVASVGGSLVSGYMSSSAADDAAAGVAAGNEQAVAETRRQFDAIQKLLSPYAEAGTGALTAQQNLLGLNGGTAQQSAIDAISSSPMFTSLQQQGTNAILQNASATGGLRGGNVQAALQEFSPQLLAQMIQQQYSNLGGITSLGQNAAAGVGNAGMQSGNTIAQLLQNTGQANAASSLAQGRAWSGAIGNISGQLAKLF